LSLKADSERIVWSIINNVLPIRFLPTKHIG
jgi:hypothetical protein